MAAVFSRKQVCSEDSREKSLSLYLNETLNASFPPQTNCFPWTVFRVHLSFCVCVCSRSHPLHSFYGTSARVCAIPSICSDDHKLRGVSQSKLVAHHAASRGQRGVLFDCCHKVFAVDTHLKTWERSRLVTKALLKLSMRSGVCIFTPSESTIILPFIGPCTTLPFTSFPSFRPEVRVWATWGENAVWGEVLQFESKKPPLSHNISQIFTRRHDIHIFRFSVTYTYQGYQYLWCPMWINVYKSVEESHKKDGSVQNLPENRHIFMFSSVSK